MTLFSYGVSLIAIMPNKKILLVEDELVLQKLYLDLLTSEGYKVETASDGEEAYDKMRQGGWDLVLLDIILPKLEGLEVAKKIKANPPTNPIKSIVFLTNLDKEQNNKEVIQYGKGCIIKGNLNPEEFINKVKTYL